MARKPKRKAGEVDPRKSYGTPEFWREQYTVHRHRPCAGRCGVDLDVFGRQPAKVGIAGAWYCDDCALMTGAVQKIINRAILEAAEDEKGQDNGRVSLLREM